MLVISFQNRFHVQDTGNIAFCIGVFFIFCFNRWIGPFNSETEAQNLFSQINATIGHHKEASVVDLKKWCKSIQVGVDCQICDDVWLLKDDKIDSSGGRIQQLFRYLYVLLVKTELWGRIGFDSDSGCEV